MSVIHNRGICHTRNSATCYRLESPKKMRWWRSAAQRHPSPSVTVQASHPATDGFFLNEWSCLATADGVPKHGRAVPRSTQQRVLARPLTRDRAPSGVESSSQESIAFAASYPSPLHHPRRLADELEQQPLQLLTMPAVQVAELLALLARRDDGARAPACRRPRPASAAAGVHLELDVALPVRPRRMCDLWGGGGGQ
jgi:hypothetical protein